MGSEFSNGISNGKWISKSTQLGQKWGKILGSAGVEPTAASLWATCSTIELCALSGHKKKTAFSLSKRWLHFFAGHIAVRIRLHEAVNLSLFRLTRSSMGRSSKLLCLVSSRKLFLNGEKQFFPLAFHWEGKGCIWQKVTFKAETAPVPTPAAKQTSNEVVGAYIINVRGQRCNSPLTFFTSRFGNVPLWSGNHSPDRFTIHSPLERIQLW